MEVVKNVTGNEKEEILKCMEVVFSYPGFQKKQILQGINLSVERGQCVGILGKNGCGKTTLFHILAGLRKADRGKIICQGIEMQDRKPTDFHQHIGYVPQENFLIPEIKGKDQLALWYEKSHVEDVIEKFGLEECLNKRITALSGGMKKRLSIACAMAKNPEILILDEPAAALDLPGKKDIQKYLMEHKKQGGTILLATHDETDLQLCDKLYALKNGKCIELDETLRGENLMEKL